jgi:hypothetical protein
MTTTEGTAAKTGKPPVATLKDGLVYAKIWQRDNDSGTFYGVSFERRYKGKEEQWAATQNFGKDDLLKLARLAGLARDEIMRLQPPMSAP